MRGPAPILRILIVLALGMLTGIAPRPDDRAEFVRLMNVGKAQIENRAAAKAIETMTAARAIDPGSAAARRNLGRAYLLTGRPADAQRAIDVLTDHADASSRYLAGIASLRLSRFDVAATALEQAARLDPRTPTVRFQLGGALQASGRHDEAITQLQETIRLDPFHASAHYKLSGYARRAGRTAEANRHLREFTRLRRLLGETMRTARALETCVHTQPEAAPPPDPEPDGAGPLEIRFVDVTATVLAEDAGASIAAAAVIDVDDRGRSRIFAVDGDGGLALLTLAEEGRFVREPMGSVPPPAGEVYCRAGDFHDVVPAGERYDPAKHARNDMVVAADDAVHLLRRRDDAAFEPVTEQAGLAGARGGPVRWVDWDHDGDLDLAVGGAAGLRAWQNNGDGTFADVTTETGLAGAGPVMDFAAADLDENTAIDLVLARGDEPSLVFENRRAGRFARAPEPPGPWPAARQVLLDDVDDDGTVDAVLVHPDGALVIPAGRSGRTRVPSPGLRVTAATLVDVDNDGRLDLVLAGRAPDGAGGLRLQRNGGRGGWSDASGAAGLADLTLPVPRSLIPADFDGDGDSDLLVVTATKGLCVLRNDGGHANGQLKVRLRTLKTNPSGLGARVEVRTGLHRVTRTVSRIPIEIGLDGRSRLDSIQTVWTNGVVDNTIDVEAPAGPLVVEEKNVAAGSCPFLYAWDGTTYRFVTDILGNAPLGLSLRRDVILPADPDEIVHVGDAAALPPVAGRFRLAITDEYRELFYLDEVHLLAVDHPPSVEIHPTDRLGPPPFPPSELRAVRLAATLVRAVGSDGVDRTEALRAVDGVFAEPGHPLPPPYRGQTRPLAITLDFGPLDPAAPLVLAATGWLQYGDASTNIAISQDRSLAIVPPTLEAETADGAWAPVDVVLGMPAGKTKTILADLAGRLPADTRRLRLTTSFEIRWDRIALAQRVPDTLVTVREIPPCTADLRWRGFTEIFARAPGHPTTPDWEVVDHQPPWRTTPQGWCTRYGDVLPLVTGRDGALAILNGGDAVLLEFRADGLPALGPSSRRSFFLHSVGWDKDEDHNVVDGDTVEPMPREGSPSGDDDAAWRLQYNTRWVPHDRFHPDRPR